MTRTQTEKTTYIRKQCQSIISRNNMFFEPKIDSIAKPKHIKKTKTYVSQLPSDESLNEEEEFSSEDTSSDNSIRPQNIDSEFWKIINKLAWKDKSECRCDSRRLNRLTRKQRTFLRRNIVSYARELRSVVEPLGIFDDPYFNVALERENRINNAIYHMVAKGSQFYNACIVEPEFSMYIIGEMEFQSLYTYLN